MRDTYKAAIAEKDIRAIVEYLTKVSAQAKGDGLSAPTSDAGGASG